MTSRPWYAHFPADYERKTSHLTMLEDGAYRRLLDHYYATGKPLPANAERLYRVCRAFADAERAAIDSTLAQFFVLRRDGYHNTRADEELVKAQELGEKRRNAAFSRHAIAGHLQVHLHTPSPSPSHSKKEVSLPAKVAATHSSKNLLNGRQKDFEEFWTAYPKHVGKRDAMKAYAKALGRAESAAILQGAKAYARSRKGEDQTYTKGPAKWLNADCWLDECAAGDVLLTPEQAEAARDKADRILKRGKYEGQT